MNEEEGATPVGATPKIAAAKQDRGTVYASSAHIAIEHAESVPVGHMRSIPTAHTDWHCALEVDADGAREFAAQHPGWWLFPGAVVERRSPMSGITTFDKIPRCRWTEVAAAGPDLVEQLWRRIVGDGVAAVCLYLGPSRLWVLDQDRDIDAWPEWSASLRALVEERGTLVRSSCTRRQPHYFFTQGEPANDEYVGAGTWVGGDVKAGIGYVVLSDAAPVVDAPIRPATREILELVRTRRRSLASGGTAQLNHRELEEWLDTTPGDDERLVAEEYEDRFLARVVDRYWVAVEGGDHRRMAALKAVYTATLEAAAGIYSARTAFEAIGDAYYESRQFDLDPAKRWGAQRQRDFLSMWRGAAAKAVDGHLDDQVAEVRSNFLERYGEDEWSEAEIEELFGGLGV